MKSKPRKFTLDRPLDYQIRVPGNITKESLDWNGGLTISVGESIEGSPITIIEAKVDQAGLHGLLRYLYSVGLPIISVVCVEYV